MDHFVGSGTRLLAARDLERNAVGFDLKSEYINLCNQRTSQMKLGTKCQQIAINEDAF